ncbi:leucine-rich repeat protein [Treponema sp. OMZ 855]|uniref:leucine-rich repeat protein n=1 Tax=Treponema sp. OMZ 855 TaxID=1643512 RepID=UPI0020A35F44|nr:leucine-rich repeat protein [Treponema sp. OMZ 855]UTC51108.1 leucine-rich repeat protein [Treponema sp. OMZ 855]
MNTDTIRMRKFFNRITVAVLAVIVSLLCTACPQNGGASGNNTGSYTQVPFAQLDDYLKTKASASTVNYIEVTGLKKEDLGGLMEASPLGKTLKASPSKKVALKFGGKIEGLTSMGSCFDGCETLVQVSGIPEGVTNMGSCFYGCTNLRQAPVIPESVEAIYFCFSHCTNLKQAPVIPANVTDMYKCFLDCENLQNVVLKCNYNPARDSSNKPYFKDTFDGCTALTAGGIKVPAGQLETYKTNADVMGVTEDKFAAE